MPSGGLRSIDEDDARWVAVIAKEAFRHGLQVEWFQYFIGGIQDGVPVKEAADRAAIEWDF